MYCNTRHFAGTLPIISISRGHFTLTDIKGTDMEAGRDPDLVKIQNCSEHTQSSWNQIRSWKKPACEAVSKLKSGLLSEDWSSNRGVSDRVNTRKIQILGKFIQIAVIRLPRAGGVLISRWCVDSWLHSDQQFLREREGGETPRMENNLCLLFIYLPPGSEFFLLASNPHLWNQGQNILKKQLHPQSVIF